VREFEAAHQTQIGPPGPPLSTRRPRYALYHSRSRGYQANLRASTGMLIVRTREVISPTGRAEFPPWVPAPEHPANKNATGGAQPFDLRCACISPSERPSATSPATSRPQSRSLPGVPSDFKSAGQRSRGVEWLEDRRQAVATGQLQASLEDSQAATGRRPSSRGSGPRDRVDVQDCSRYDC
jgi:hypothetical protein